MAFKRNHKQRPHDLGLSPHPEALALPAGRSDIRMNTDAARRSPEPDPDSSRRGYIRDAGFGIPLEPQGLSAPLICVTSGEASGEEVRRESGGRSAPAKTVLLVEDDDLLRSAVARMLRKRDFVVMEAADGLAAVEMFQTNRNVVDLMVLDVNLPGIAGPQVLEEVRKIRPDIKVIFTSAYSREMALPGEPRGQICDFIRKPYRIAELLNLLQR